MSEIDVSKCPYFVEEHEWWDITGDKQITKNCCDIYLNDELNRFDYYEKCADNPNCYYKQLQQLKQENEELKSKLALFSDIDYAYESTELENSLGLANKYVNKYKATLDEIEETINNCQISNCGSCKYYYTGCITIDNTILNIIKHAKEE